MEGCGRDLILGYYTRIRLEGLMNVTKSLCQDIRSLNPGPPKHKAGVPVAGDCEHGNVVLEFYIMSTAS